MNIAQPVVDAQFIGLRLIEQHMFERAPPEVDGLGGERRLAHAADADDGGDGLGSCQRVDAEKLALQRRQLPCTANEMRMRAGLEFGDAMAAIAARVKLRVLPLGRRNARLLLIVKNGGGMVAGAVQALVHSRRKERLTGL